MNHSICGADCAECMMKNTCKGCTETKGCPFGKQCFIAEYINIGGKDKYQEFKQLLNSYERLQKEGGSGLVKAKKIVKYDLGCETNDVNIYVKDGKCIAIVSINLINLRQNENSIS